MGLIPEKHSDSERDVWSEVAIALGAKRFDRLRLLGAFCGAMMFGIAFIMDLLWADAGVATKLFLVGSVSIVTVCGIWVVWKLWDARRRVEKHRAAE